MASIPQKKHNKIRSRRALPQPTHPKPVANGLLAKTERKGLSAITLKKDRRIIGFIAPVLGRRPISKNTINAALRRLGYAQDEMTGHGFRAMAATLLNERGGAGMPKP